MNPIPYGRQDIDEKDIKAVVDVLRSDFLTQGPRVQEFEKKFAEYIGSKYAVAVANGTAALHLSALALGSISRLVGSIRVLAQENCSLFSPPFSVSALLSRTSVMSAEL